MVAEYLSYCFLSRVMLVLLVPMALLGKLDTAYPDQRLPLNVFLFMTIE